MKGKVVVMTGATSGIGQATAEALARQGARIVQVARDEQRGEEAMARLRDRAPGIAHAIFYAELLKLSEMKRVAADIARTEPRVDVLINNAGAIFGTRELTEDGLERTFALNHMAYFVITQGLRERLLAAAPARVINTSSDAHKYGDVDFSDLQSAKALRGNILDWVLYGGPAFKVYGTSKLCNILFTRELARRLAGTGVTVNCAHPGLVATRFGDAMEGFMRPMIRLAQRFALTPEQGAATLVYLASSPDVATVTGQYFVKCHPTAPSAAARDDAAAKRLWAESEKLEGP
jgi:NAD(P)-dependent dehydrogenase (short-subunit alcohol dehydrogenase family)